LPSNGKDVLRTFLIGVGLNSFSDLYPDIVNGELGIKRDWIELESPTMFLQTVAYGSAGTIVYPGGNPFNYTNDQHYICKVTA
jgi:hypothetical protein